MIKYRKFLTESSSEYKGLQVFYNCLALRSLNIVNLGQNSKIYMVPDRAADDVMFSHAAHAAAQINQ